MVERDPEEVGVGRSNRPGTTYKMEDCQSGNGPAWKVEAGVTAA